jgi:hypothetical protein
VKGNNLTRNENYTVAAELLVKGIIEIQFRTLKYDFMHPLWILSLVR